MSQEGLKTTLLHMSNTNKWRTIQKIYISNTHLYLEMKKDGLLKLLFLDRKQDLRLNSRIQCSEDPLIKPFIPIKDLNSISLLPMNKDFLMLQID